ncbi:hypothetical protein [Streptomyces virginiae]|uniref:hypothetical protein n=1 Tax=Streptomyces virginiae TaxID=1961 RepID=UPI0022501789|nr:hypothetical protein [Streptomyces virginiae]MCX4962405.1 hypothetical protein [Streptomyces virginiae]MCX5179646.1 hypothetical protein [Streptomyces virginiae]
MGGRQHTQPGRRGRPGLRRAALLIVFGVLAGALLLCARSGESHAPAPGAQVRAGAPAHAVCVSPYDLPGCSPLTRVTPGVLPVPPPAVTGPMGAPAPAAIVSGASRIPLYGAPPRAPDLYALQVLRT